MLSKKELTDTYLKYSSEITEDIFNKVKQKIINLDFPGKPRGWKPGECYQDFVKEEYFLIGVDFFSYGVDNNSQNAKKEVKVSDIIEIEVDSSIGIGIPKAKLELGKVYSAAWTAFNVTKCYAIFKYVDKNFHSNEVLSIHNKDYSLDYQGLTDPSLTFNLATQEEIKHLIQCRNAGKYVEFNSEKKAPWYESLKEGDYVVTASTTSQPTRTPNTIFKIVKDFKSDNRIHYSFNASAILKLEDFRPAAAEEIAMYKEAGRSVDVTTYKMKSMEKGSNYKFKIGDRVKVIGSGNGISHAHIGKETTIVELGLYTGSNGYKVDNPKLGNSLTPDNSYKGFIHENSFELVEAAFKLPNKVRVKDCVKVSKWASETFDCDIEVRENSYLCITVDLLPGKNSYIFLVDSGTYSEYTELTFDEFKKYVIKRKALKAPLKVDTSLKVGDYVVALETSSEDYYTKGNLYRIYKDKVEGQVFYIRNDGSEGGTGNPVFRKATEKEVKKHLEVKPLIPSEASSLPEKWFIRFKNDEQFRIIKPYFVSKASYYNTYVNNDPNRVWTSSLEYYASIEEALRGGFTEITLEQFKKYVLKESSVAVKKDYAFKKDTWYKYDHINDLYYLRNIIDSIDRLSYDEYILVRTGKHEKSSGSYPISNEYLTTEEVPMSVIDKFISVKSKTMLSKEELIDGEIYLYDNTHITMYPRGSMVSTISKTFSPKSNWEWTLNIKEATAKQKKWLKTCMQQGRGIRESDLDNYDDTGCLLKKESGGLKYEKGAYVMYKGTKSVDGAWDSYFGNKGVKAGDVGIINSKYDSSIYVKDNIRGDYTSGTLLEKDLTLITKEEYEQKLASNAKKESTKELIMKSGYFSVNEKLPLKAVNAWIKAYMEYYISRGEWRTPSSYFNSDPKITGFDNIGGHPCILLDGLYGMKQQGFFEFMQPYLEKDKGVEVKPGVFHKWEVGDVITYKSKKDCLNQKYNWGGEDLGGQKGTIMSYGLYNSPEKGCTIYVSTPSGGSTYTMLESEFQEWNKKPILKSKNKGTNIIPILFDVKKIN